MIIMMVGYRSFLEGILVAEIFIFIKICVLVIFFIWNWDLIYNIFSLNIVIEYRNFFLIDKF